jgi:hypothetical protein
VIPVRRGAFEYHPQAAFDFITRVEPLTEGGTASRKPYQDLRMSVGRKEKQLASRVIASVESQLAPSHVQIWPTAIMIVGAVLARL